MAGNGIEPQRGGVIYPKLTIDRARDQNIFFDSTFSHTPRPVKHSPSPHSQFFTAKSCAQNYLLLEALRLAMLHDLKCDKNIENLKEEWV